MTAMRETLKGSFIPGFLFFLLIGIMLIILGLYLTPDPVEHNTMITIKDKAIDRWGEHLILDANNDRWWVEDPFLYNGLMIGQTYEVLYKETSRSALEGIIIGASPVESQSAGGVKMESQKCQEL